MAESGTDFSPPDYTELLEVAIMAGFPGCCGAGATLRALAGGRVFFLCFAIRSNRVWSAAWARLASLPAFLAAFLAALISSFAALNSLLAALRRVLVRRARSFAA